MPVPEKDAFDFSEQVFGSASAQPHEVAPPQEEPERDLSLNAQVKTSYILVNALLNILVRKGIIQQSEVNTIVAELHQEYLSIRKGRGANGTE